VITEALKDLVPNWLVVLYHQRLRQRHPDVINHQEAAAEVFKLEVLDIS
jgi:hypothetical protein